MDEPPTNATEEHDVKIDATEPLPLNGTIMVDITEADDIEFNAIPPEGVSIIITNSTVTVTNSPVDIEERVESLNTTGMADGGTSSADDEADVEGDTIIDDDNSDEEDNIDATEDNVEEDDEDEE